MESLLVRSTFAHAAFSFAVRIAALCPVSPIYVEQVAFARDSIDCTRFVHGRYGWASFEKVGAKGRGRGEDGINVEFLS